MDRMNTASGALAYETAGAGEPVLFIYGAFIADTFRPLLAEHGLADRYRLIHYHRPGYGSAGRASGVVSISSQAAGSLRLLRHLGMEPAHVVGHSYGGAIALQLALDSPGSVHSLTLLEPALMVGASASGYRESLIQSVERYREVGAAAVLDGFLEARCPGYRSILDRELPGAFDQAVDDAATWFDFELPGLLDWHFAEAEAGHVRQPVLSVLGGESASLSPRFAETHQTLLTLLPRAEGVVLPGATHLMQLENPRGIAGVLAEFFARNPILKSQSSLTGPND